MKLSSRSVLITKPPLSPNPRKRKNVWEESKRFFNFPSPSVCAQRITKYSAAHPQYVSARPYPLFDWKETPTEHVFIVDVPGLKKEDLKVEVVVDRVLQTSGERRNSSGHEQEEEEEEEEKNHKWHRAERSKVKFTTSFDLPQNANVDEVKAAMEDGVLTVTIPVKKPHIRSIEIST